jgi:ParB family chromosome partitioning protein
MAGNRQHAVDGNAEIDRPTPGATWHRTATALHERHESETSVRQLDVDLLRPGRYQPRRRFTSEALTELAESIRTEGVVQPIIVRPLPDTAPTRYEIIAGERRWRAAQLAGLQHIPALVRSTDDRSTLIQALV